MARPKGAINKRTVALIEAMEERWPDYHPVLAMMAVANDDKVAPELRFQANKEVAQYVSAKRKAVEVDAGPAIETIVYEVLGKA